MDAYLPCFNERYRVLGEKRKGGAGMSWNYRQPKRSDFDTLEEYESALAAYERAEDDYVDQYVEEYLISKYF